MLACGRQASSIAIAAAHGRFTMPSPNTDPRFIPARQPPAIDRAYGDPAAWSDARQARARTGDGHRSRARARRIDTDRIVRVVSLGRGGPPELRAIPIAPHDLEARGARRTRGKQ